MPLKSVLSHPTDNPLMTPNIKAEIKLRQQAFAGSMSQYNLLCVKVEDMIRKAKSNYYIIPKLKHSAHLTLRNYIKLSMICPNTYI